MITIKALSDENTKLRSRVGKLEKDLAELKALVAKLTAGK